MPTLSMYKISLNYQITNQVQQLKIDIISCSPAINIDAKRHDSEVRAMPFRYA